MAETDLLSVLARMTEGLRPDHGASEEDLEALRFLIARDLDARVATTGVASLPRVEALTIAETETFERFTLGSSEAPVARLIGNAPTATVDMRSSTGTLPFDVSGASGIIRNINPDRVVGPFFRPGGGIFTFDIFLPAARLILMVEGEAQPLMVFSSARRRTTQNDPDIDLEPGSVWVRADAVVPGAPAGAYIGFRITDGKVAIGTPTSFAGDTITAKAPFAGELTLDLAPPTPGTGCEDVKIKAPTKATLVWDSGNVKGEVDGGLAQIHGEEFKFTPIGTVSVNTVSNRLVFDCKIDPSGIDMSRIQSPLAKLQGETPLVDTGWSVPLTFPPNPVNLGEAAGEGAWFARCAKPFAIYWQGGPQSPTVLHDAVMLAGEGLFSLFTYDARQDDASAEQVFELWSLADSGKPLPLRTTFPSPFTCALGCDDERGEYVAFGSRYHPVFDRPVDAIGRMIPFAPVDALTLIQEQNQVQTVTVVAQSQNTANADDPRRMVLENAYLAVYGRAFMGFRGTLKDEKRVVDATLSLVFTVGGWMPTLPDPYVTNLAMVRDRFEENGQVGRLSVQIAWEGGPPAVTFEGLLNAPDAGGKAPTRDPVGPGLQNEVWYRGDSQTEDGRILRGGESDEEWRKAEALAVRALKTAADQADDRNRDLTRTVVNYGEEMMGNRGGGGLLLDVSTNRHQIGVQIGVGHSNPTVGLSHAPGLGTPGAYQIQERSVWTSLSNVRVFTLPLVQWEPVRTLDKDQDLVTLGYFPTPLASADDGGPTVIGMQSARLAASIPDIALDGMVQEFGIGRPMGMVTTLPFGLKAGLMLQPFDQGVRKADTVSFTTPRFDTDERLDGGLQLTIKASDEQSTPGEESPSFQGTTAQLLNGVILSTGAPLGISVLGSTLGSDGSVESMFNNEFVDARPRVPLTRYDVSGYGGTTFSDWSNPRGAFAEATKVQFQLMVGRTALEIVKFASVIYPWGVKVTRSVTIERRGGGGVIRRDSGWQASSPGLFDFRHKTRASPADPWVEQPSPFTVHPGLIKGVFNVERIRPAANDAIDLPSGGQVLGMYFDAIVAVDGVPGGETKVTGMVGYLHVKPVGLPITDADLEALIQREGAIGGPIDSDLNVAASGFTMRALRVEMDTTRNGPVRVLVGAVRGAPKFGPSGAWSVIRQAGPANPSAPDEAEVISDGAPIIREGRIGVPSGTDLTFTTPRGDYRFAEAEDLFSPGVPSWELGFLQTTPTHAFLYRRPFIRAGGNRIESNLNPCFADLFARSVSQSLFPAPEHAIELGNQPYTLDINPATGFFRLAQGININNPRPALAMSDGPDRYRVFYDQATLDLAIEEDTWNLQPLTLELWQDMAGLERMTGTKLTIVGGTSVKPVLMDIENLMTGPLRDIIRSVPGINDLYVIGPVDLAPTNLKVKPKIAASFEMMFDLVPTLLAIKVYGKVFVGYEYDSYGSQHNGTVGGLVGVDLRGRVNAGAVAWVYGASVELGGKVYFAGPLQGDTKPFFEIKIYSGVGQGGDVGPFTAKWTVALGGVVQYDGVWKYGGFVFFEAKVEICGTGLKIYGEFIFVVYEDIDPSTMLPAQYYEFGGEVGISLKICYFLYIKFTAQILVSEKF